MPAEITFTSHGVNCAGWHVVATTGALANQAGRPCVVMAHGFGGTRDSGLLDYADEFARVGIDAFVFDYRGFGASEGAPRQDVAYKRQREDYHAALDAAGRLPGVDLGRIALWGTSYAGGHSIAVAAQAPESIAAVVAMNPALDGLAALGAIARSAGVGPLCWATAAGLRDAFGAALSRRPHLVPIVGQPGTRAMITTQGAEEAFLEMAGPTARNEVCARHALEAARNRPAIYADKVEAPTLLQIGTNDKVAPPSVARRVAARMGHRATLMEYPIDHFDVYDDPWRGKVCADQVEFLVKALTD
jgi:pimeloyl-ACP methyl ester carboxylesterase